MGVLLLIGLIILLQKGNNFQKKRSICGKNSVLCGLDQGPAHLEVLVCVSLIMGSDFYGCFKAAAAQILPNRDLSPL